MISKLDLNGEPSSSIPALLGTKETCYVRESSSNECLPVDSPLDRLLRSLDRRKFGRGLAAVPSYSASGQRCRS